jgi:hypothetical protein
MYLMLSCPITQQETIVQQKRRVWLSPRIQAIGLVPLPSITRAKYYTFRHVSNVLVSVTTLDDSRII